MGPGRSDGGRRGQWPAGALVVQSRGGKLSWLGGAGAPLLHDGQSARRVKSQLRAHTVMMLNADPGTVTLLLPLAGSVALLFTPLALPAR